MNSPLLAGFAVLVVLAGCGRLAESRINPFNWFGDGRQQAVTVEAPPQGFDAVRADGRPLIADVARLSVDRMPGGAIVRATGLPPTQGHWDVALLPANEGAAVDGRLTYYFVAAPPPQRRRAGPARSREVVAAAFVSDQDLAGVDAITVIGANSQATTRR